MLEEKKEYIVEVKFLGYEGEGVVKIDGYFIFILGVLKDEKVKVKIVKVKKNYVYGKFIEVIDRCDERRELDCFNYEKCGGCILEYLSYNG